MQFSVSGAETQVPIQRDWVNALTDGSKPAVGAGSRDLHFTLCVMDVDETQIVRPAQQVQAAADDQ